jgi:hypothetical protein
VAAAAIPAASRRRFHAALTEKRSAPKLITVTGFYRLAVWLPLVLPALVAGLVHGVGIVIDAGPLRKIVQILLASLLYGGVPYAMLAIWATWWLGGRSEPEIKRVILVSPLIMAVGFAVVSAATGIAVGHVGPFLAVAVLGAIISIPLGYGYVGLVLLLREQFGPR